VTFRLREADLGDADLGAIADIVNTTNPDDPTSIDEMRWSSSAYPDGSRFIVDVDGRPVGTAGVGRIHVLPPEFDGFWANLQVLAGARRQGIGSALLAAVSDRARTAGKTALHVPASEARPEGIDFLSHRGFREYERSKTVRLELAGLERPSIDLAEGLRLTTLAAEPGLVEGVHAVAVETFADIPGGDQPMVPGDLAEFRKRDVDRAAIPPAAFMIAVDRPTGRVVGYASLLLMPAGTRRLAWHGMTAVARDWRGRGLAGALKRATIGWAIDNGLDAVESNNDTDNLAMRAVNARLGYQPAPDSLIMRGPLFAGIMAR
jgi:GNAT superfamily N-acetyltransferase